MKKTSLNIDYVIKCLDRYKVKPSAKVMMMYIMAEGSVTATAKEVEARTGVPLRTVQREMASLQRVGAINIERNRLGGRITGNTYTWRGA